ncbi:MAG: SMC-Scp complex subunit ScpB [Planctomycetaceae bacterium]|nr:SMC-Scp complex subunit ScpB [Planctomycetaceae bacterium]
MSAKKNDKKNFVLTNNVDLSGKSGESDDIIVTENTGKNVSLGEISGAAAAMCNKLGAKYYVEDIVEDEEDEAILSLESLRDMFMSVKSGESGRGTFTGIKIADYTGKQDVANTYNEPEYGEKNSSETNLNDDENYEIGYEGSTVAFTNDVDDTDSSSNNDSNDDEEGNDKEDSELLEEGIFDQSVAGEVTIQVSPQSIFEAMLFVGDRDNKPLTAERAAEKMRNVQPQELDEAVESLNRKYNMSGAPYKIVEDRGGYRMVLRDEFSTIQEKFYGKIREAKLSQAAIDTLAIVAYKQPITADEIHILRKQPSSALLAQLVRRGLIQLESETKNKKKKIFYKTTQRFLELFQLTSIEDLPISEDFDFR